MHLVRGGSAESEQWCRMWAQWLLWWVKSSVALLWNQDCSRSPHCLPFLKHYMKTGEVLPFHRQYRKMSRRAVCISVRHFSLRLMEEQMRSNTVQVNRGTAAVNKRWRLTINTFQFCSGLPLSLPWHWQHVDVRCAHYMRRHFPPPSWEKPAEGQVSIIHRWDEQEYHSFHPCLTQV